MRYRVDLRYGYASFDERDRDKAFALYAEEGLRIRRGPRLGEEDELVDGLPIGVDLQKAVAA